MAKKTLACLSPVGIQPAFMRHGALALGCSCTQLTIPHWSGAIFGALAAAEKRENELINRINELDRIRPGL